MTTATIDIPDKLVDLFEGEADVRGAKGGRGSAKTRTFAKMTAIRAYQWDMAGREGIILCARQFMNSLDESSLEEVKAAIRSEPWLEPFFEIGEKYIRTKSGRISYGFAGLSRNIGSIKSKSRILLCWVDEAENVSDPSWIVLIPTIREDGSELWLTWNPERKASATNKRFGDDRAPDPRVKIETINWRDNPWFPDKLNRDRLRDKEQRPEQYGHIWDGEYVTALSGAYYARQIQQARDEGRIGAVARDPLLTLRAVWDIGGTGVKADATAIWIVQHVGTEIRFLDYYEAVGQPLAAHVEWLRNTGYGAALCILPHDGASHEKVYATTYEGALREAGFQVRIVPNQGAGAAMQRVERARRLFPRMRFDAQKCSAGIDAIGWYHEKRDENRGIGLGPDHDWSSHGSDAFGLEAVAYEEPVTKIYKPRPQVEVRGAAGWMAGAR